ncbi:hypothetical protein N8590_02560 [bacterium]|jgi:hypothetical protein|nr:hypothetical protein [Planctomicrobium sp.]MDA7527847.1 hypothetical protein [bacterium]MDB4802600.1 hypothetical protein [bacterium]
MTFYWTTTTLLLSATVLVVAAICCWISWKRSGYGRSVGLLELLRFALVFLAVLTLNQPELTQEFKPQERPTLVVLYDTSGSMKTQDVVDPLQPAAVPKTRLKTVESLTGVVGTDENPELPELWKPATKNLDVVFEPFSSEMSTPSKGTDIDLALSKTIERHGNLRGVVLLSDGDWNTGNTPSAAATDLRMKNIPIYTVGIGSEERLPDVELASMDAPTFGIAGKTLRIPFQVLSWLPRDREIKITLSGTRGQNIEKTIRVPGMGQVRDTINWFPEKVGEYDLTIKIPVDDGEINPENNELKFPITIKSETLKVLVVESYPRWEYRYLRNALERDPGVDVNCLLFHPDLDDVGGGRGYIEEFPSEKDLFEYDVVFLGDVGIEPKQLNLEHVEHLRQLVRNHAGGLVFLPGFRGKQSTLLTTELEELYPVITDAAVPKGYGSPHASRFTLTESGRRSLLTRLEMEERENERVWKNLPGFQWYAGALRAKIGGQVLAVHETESSRFGRVPLIVTRTSGTGKVLFMGTDGAWRWRKGVEDLYHYRFWGQVVRWMAYQRNMSQGESMRLFYSPDRPEADNVLTLNANVMSTSGEPLRNGTVITQITSPSGQTDALTLAPAGEDSWGLFTGTFVPEEGGQYELVTKCVETGAQLETTIAVQGLERERIGEPARYDVLKEIATVSRGRLVSTSEIEDLVNEIADLPEPEPIIRRFRLWSHPAWGGVLIVLLSVFWIGRKLAGLA